MNLPVYNCLVDESIEDQSGIYAVSFVDAPANETEFVALSRHHKKEHLSKDSKKQILTGVVLRPDQLIYRNDAQMGEYYIRFSSDQIEKIAAKMMRTGVALHNTTHQHQDALSGNYLTELWIVEDPANDKSRALGFADLPKGTLMCSYKIEDKTYWDTQIMSGNVRGFSLEGFFIQKKDQHNLKSNLNKNSTQQMNKTDKRSKTLLSRIARFLMDIQAVEKADATASGSTYVIFALADGKEVYVDSDGFATLDGEQLPAGEHPLANNNILVVDEQGQFVETKEAAQKTEDPEQATATQALSGSEGEPQYEPEESVDALKAKIAELETKLAELAALAGEANAEVQKMRRHTPSVMPVPASLSSQMKADAKRHEKMAQALSQTITLRRK